MVTFAQAANLGASELGGRVSLYPSEYVELDFIHSGRIAKRFG
jgi:hypothetical protein